MMLEEQTVPTAAELPIREFADHLRLGSGFTDDGSEDAVLEVFVRSALAAVEARIGKALIRRSFSWTVTRWFEVEGQALPIAPVQAISSVTITKSDGSSEILDPDTYRLESDTQRPKLAATGSALPSIPTGGSAEMVFEAGFGAWIEVPSDLKQAVFLLGASYYENRAGEAQMNGLPFGVSALLDKYRPARLGGAR